MADDSDMLIIGGVVIVGLAGLWILKSRREQSGALEGNPSYTSPRTTKPSTGDYIAGGASVLQDAILTANPLGRIVKPGAAILGAGADLVNYGLFGDKKPDERTASENYEYLYGKYSATGSGSGLRVKMSDKAARQKAWDAVYGTNCIGAHCAKPGEPIPPRP